MPQIVTMTLSPDAVRHMRSFGSRPAPGHEPAPYEPTAGDLITRRLTSGTQAAVLVGGGAVVGGGVGLTREQAGKGAVLGALTGLGVHVLASVVLGVVGTRRDG